MTRYSAVCEYVEDGDTFRTAMGNWIRLADVCAPKGETQEGAKATRILSDLILGKDIVYEQVGTSYGRMVAEVVVEGMSVNEYMRLKGYTCP